MKRKWIGIIISLLFALTLSACGDQTDAATEALRTDAAVDPTNTAQPAAADTTVTVDEPTLTHTPMASATMAPTLTPTITPTSEIIYNAPGFYAYSGYATYKVLAYPAPKPVTIEFCVLHITINQDGHMVFAVSWAPVFGGGGTITKYSDAHNPAMQIRDNLGNKHGHIATGGAAAKDSQVSSGGRLRGWFEFSKAPPGATSFTFYDNDNDISIGPFTFNVAPIILTELLELNWYPQSLEYNVDLWEPGIGGNGGGQVTHLNIANCLLTEWEPSPPESVYKNTIDIGGITFEIYGWNETDWSVREYVAIAGLEEESEVPPIFRMTIPFDESLQCIFDASTVLGTFQIIER